MPKDKSTAPAEGEPTRLPTAEPSESKQATQAAPAQGPAASTPDERPISHHVVAAGVSVTSKRGLLHAGAVISERDLGGGKATFDGLVKSERVIPIFVEK